MYSVAPNDYLCMKIENLTDFSRMLLIRDNVQLVLLNEAATILLGNKRKRDSG